MTITVDFEFEKTTKRTVRYKEVGNSHEEQAPADTNGLAVGTLYVKKWILGEPYPKALAVTIEVAD